MIILSAETDKIQAVLGGAVTTNQLQCISSWRDITTTTYVPGRTLINTNSGSDVDIVGSPGASTQRAIDYISIYNADTVAATLTVKLDANGTEYIIWKGVLQTLEKIEYVDGIGWRKLSAAGDFVTSYTSSPVDLQSWTTSGNKTWTKPTSFTPKSVRVILYGGGGGGGGGGSNTAGVVRTGGCGGGGGNRAEMIYNAADLGITEPVVVGAGGPLGAGGAQGADGADGTVGGNTTFSTGLPLLTAYGGGGGYRGRASAQAGAGGAGGGQVAVGGTGTTSAATGGGPGAPATPNGACGANSLATAGTPVTAEYGGGAGGGNTNIPANGVGGYSLYGGAGGGHGAGSTVAPALVAATVGGGHQTGVVGGAIGASGVAPTAGTAGSAGNMYVGGQGGGGGGGTITANTNGGVGGDGGGCGGGAGGGGVGNNTGSGGNGGTGGVGAAFILSW